MVPASADGTSSSASGPGQAFDSAVDLIFLPFQDLPKLFSKMRRGLAFGIFPVPALFLIISYSSWALCIPRSNRQPSLTVHGIFQYSSGLASFVDRLRAENEQRLELYENLLIYYRFVIITLYELDLN